MADLERFDPALLGVAQQISATAAPGENPIDTLLDIYFGFLRRKTDFFRHVAVSCELARSGARSSACGATLRHDLPRLAAVQRRSAGRRAEAAAAYRVLRAGGCVTPTRGARVRRRAFARRAGVAMRAEALAG